MNAEDKNRDEIALAQQVLAIEARAVNDLIPRIGSEFSTACTLCLACTGRIVVTGMGKSGHIGGKIAATLASTGAPSFFVHPGEASHGDLGMITANDLVLAVSYSGETQEIVTILPLIKRLGVKLITLTGKPSSTLALAADANLDVAISEEACPLNLAPTASTTATLAMGDALAVALLEKRGFTAEDFARSHPGGSLGKRLLLQVRDIMHTGAGIPTVSESITLSDGLVVMSNKGLGMVAIVDETNHLLGVFTDGDLRRALDHELNIHSTRMSELVKSGCITVSPDTLAAEAVHILEQNQITALLVTDDNQQLVGALNIHDLLRAGVM